MSRVRRLPPPWCDGPVLVLLVAAFVSGAGVFLVVPYLALHLRDGAGLSSAAVGLLLGLSYWSTRVSGLAAGALTHRWGMRRVMVFGNLLRVAGYPLLLGDSLAQMTCAVLLIGTGSGVFSPVARAALLRAVAGEHQLKAASVRALCANAGMALGPLVGMLVFVRGSAALFVLAAVVFAALSPLLWRLRLPEAGDGSGAGPAYWRGAVALAGRRPVLLITAATTLLGLAVVQLESAFPLLVVGGASVWPAGGLFVVNAVLLIVAQGPVTRAVAGRGARPVFVAGFALLAAAFVLLSAPGSWWPLWLLAIGVFGVGEVGVGLWIDDRVRAQGADDATTVYGLSGVGDACGGLVGALFGAALIGGAEHPTAAGDGWSGYWALAPLLMAAVLALIPLLPASARTGGPGPVPLADPGTRTEPEHATGRPGAPYAPLVPAGRNEADARPAHLDSLPVVRLDDFGALTREEVRR
ncbi:MULTISPECIES: MFS transporter [unclassified Streptomyces]|uniref:MFS transporter n=1 Tax=unclassified Streptomyces TaxID=2593676 RepID=UPI00368DAE92